MNGNNFLEINNLYIKFKANNGNDVYAVNNVSLKINKGVINGIIGESGSGKSTVAFGIVNLLPKNGEIVSGSIKFKGQELTNLTNKQLEEIRGNKICFIPQNPMSSLDPFYTIGNQIKEVIVKKNKLKLKEYIATQENISIDDIKKEKLKNSKNIKDKIIDLLKLVSINEPEEVIKKYPNELSGGMLQRIIIAMSLIAEPDLLIADEPTTALDVTVQLQILELIKSIQKKTKMSVIFITHDLGVIAKICDFVNVMYAGNVVESGSVDDIFYNPKHEYTKSLIQSMPKLDKSEFIPIKGNPIDVSQLPVGCPFQPRCNSYLKECLEKNIKKFEISNQHETSCLKYLFEALKNKEISEKQFESAINNQILPIKEKDYSDIVEKYNEYLKIKNQITIKQSTKPEEYKLEEQNLNKNLKNAFFEYKKLKSKVNSLYKQKYVEYDEKKFLVETDIKNNVKDIKKLIKIDDREFLLEKTKTFNYLSNLKISNLTLDDNDLFFSAISYLLMKDKYQKCQNDIKQLTQKYELEKQGLKDKYQIEQLTQKYELEKMQLEGESKKIKLECEISKNSYKIIQFMRKNMFNLQKYIVKVAIKTNKKIKKLDQKLDNKKSLNKKVVKKEFIKEAYENFIKQKKIIETLENDKKTTLNQLKAEIIKLNQLYINYLDKIYDEQI